MLPPSGCSVLPAFPGRPQWGHLVRGCGFVCLQGQGCAAFWASGTWHLSARLSECSRLLSQAWGPAPPVAVASAPAPVLPRCPCRAHLQRHWALGMLCAGDPSSAGLAVAGSPRGCGFPSGVPVFPPDRPFPGPHVCGSAGSRWLVPQGRGRGRTGKEALCLPAPPVGPVVFLLLTLLCPFCPDRQMSPRVAVPQVLLRVCQQGLQRRRPGRLVVRPLPLWLHRRSVRTVFLPHLRPPPGSSCLDGRAQRRPGRWAHTEAAKGGHGAKLSLLSVGRLD